MFTSSLPAHRQPLERTSLLYKWTKLLHSHKVLKALHYTRKMGFYLFVVFLPPRCFKGKLLRQEIPFFTQTLIPVFTRKQSTHKRRELLLLKSFLCKRVSLASRMMTLLSVVSQTRLSFFPISFLFSSREPFLSFFPLRFLNKTENSMTIMVTVIIWPLLLAR